MTDAPDDDIDLDGPLWRFAVDFYGRPGVASTCLALQDEAGVDVPELLVALYLATVGGRHVDPAAIDAARAALGDWRERTVLPLRALRRQLRSPSQACPSALHEHLRAEIKAAELLAERIQIALLDRYFRLRPLPSAPPALGSEEAVAMVLRSVGVAARSRPSSAVGVLAAALRGTSGRKDDT